MAVLSSVIQGEAAKRRERMHKAVAKNCFEITHTQQFRVVDGEKVVSGKMWEIFSTHTHKSGRYYIVSQIKTETAKTVVYTWTCTCPDFEQNGKWVPCKHILFVQEGAL